MIASKIKFPLSLYFILFACMVICGLYACDEEPVTCTSDQGCTAEEACVVGPFDFEGTCLPKAEGCTNSCPEDDRVCVKTNVLVVNCYTTYLNRSEGQTCFEDEVCASGSCAISEDPEVGGLGVCDTPEN